MLCNAVLDRLVLGSNSKIKDLPKQIPGFKTHYEYQIGYGRPLDSSAPWEQFYKRRRTSHSPTGNTLDIWFQTLVGLQDRIKVRLIAGNTHAITAQEIETLWHLFPQCRVLILELAFDFVPSAGIDRRYARKYCKFGKSRRLKRRGLGKTLYWGERKSSKLVRAYFKKLLGVFRIELQLNPRLIRNLRLEDFRSIDKLHDLLLPRHFEFVKIDWAAIGRYCAENDLGIGAIDIAKEKKTLHAQMDSLRRTTRIENLYRFLKPLKTNQLVRDAIQKFVKQYKTLRLLSLAAQSQARPQAQHVHNNKDSQEVTMAD
jgi:hypothetical protein